MHSVFATCDATSAPSDSHYQHNNTRSTTLTTNIKVLLFTVQECQIVSRPSGCLEDCKSSTSNHVCASLTSRLTTNCNRNPSCRPSSNSRAMWSGRARDSHCKNITPSTPMATSRHSLPFPQHLPPSPYTYGHTVTSRLDWLCLFTQV